MPTDNPNININPVRIRLDTHGGRLLEMQTPSKGPGEYALAIAKVTRVDYEAMEASLLVMIGENDIFQRVPIPITFPGAGPRHFFGAMPEPGSYCVVGYLPSSPSKIPVILSWVVPGVQPGYDWIPTQEFEPTEFDFTPRRQTELEGIYGRVRHKLRHMAPGNIVASSAQGSDLVLDEGVLLTNRRANEIRIRDQDQAIITRSLQKFDTQGGVRVYSGMVQRDATLLPSQMFSDGIEWASFRQRLGGVPLVPEMLGDDVRIEEGGLTPHDVFYRESGPNPRSGVKFDESVDPCRFLPKSGLVDRGGGALSDPYIVLDGAVYGGKRMFRPFFDPTSDSGSRRTNSVIGEDASESETLTEHRIEVNHTWDHLLPVSDQTDGFEVDRLPGSAMDESNDLLQGDRPFIEVVYGSVVGNDPYTESGRDLYGVPLRPVIFDGGSGNTAPTLDSGYGFPVGEHAATLMKVEPPFLTDVNPTWFSIRKDGKVRFSVGGSGQGNSIEGSVAGGIRVVAGGQISFEGSGGIQFLNRGGTATGNVAYEFNAPTGAIRVSAGGPITEGNIASRLSPSDGPPEDAPHLLLDAPKGGGNTHVSANRVTRVSAGKRIEVDRAGEMRITIKDLVAILTDKMSVQAKTVDKTVLGQEAVIYSGPKNFLPTNTPLRSVTFAGTPLTGHVGGATDKYKMVLGDREEIFLKGNHETNIVVGNMTYQTGVGTITHRAGTNQVQLGTASGLSANITAGTMSMMCTTSASFKGAASVQVSSGGPATISGSICTLGGVGKVGGIVCQSDLDPLSGLPLGALGLGSPGHVLAPPVP